MALRAFFIGATADQLLARCGAAVAVHGRRRALAEARHRFGVEGLLLLRRQRRIEAARGIGALGEHRAAFGLAGLHAVQALRAWSAWRFRRGPGGAGRPDGPAAAGPRRSCSMRLPAPGVSLSFSFSAARRCGAVLLHALEALGRVARAGLARRLCAPTCARRLAASARRRAPGRRRRTRRRWPRPADRPGEGFCETRS